MAEADFVVVEVSVVAVLTGATGNGSGIVYLGCAATRPTAGLILRQTKECWLTCSLSLERNYPLLLIARWMVS